MVRSGAFDDATRRTAHEVIIESLRGQFGYVVRPHEEWIEYLDATSTFDWSQITLLEIDGRAVAIRLCDDDYVETENCGYIRILGVLEDFRGRGLAKFLLRDAFAGDAAEGRAGTILDVDTNNPHPGPRSLPVRRHEAHPRQRRLAPRRPGQLTALAPES